MLFDLCPVFDTVDHKVLLDRLEDWAELSGTAACWYKSYLEGGSFVSRGEQKSELITITCGVTCGSIRGPLLLNMYMFPLVQVIHDKNVVYHSFADDSWLFFTKRFWSITFTLSVLGASEELDVIKLPSTKTRYVRKHSVCQQKIKTKI